MEHLDRIVQSLLNSDDKSELVSAVITVLNELSQLHQENETLKRDVEELDQRVRDLESQDACG